VDSVPDSISANDTASSPVRAVEVSAIGNVFSEIICKERAFLISFTS